MFPGTLGNRVELLFGPWVADRTSPNHRISVQETSPGRYLIRGDTRRLFTDDLSEPELLDALLDEVVHSLIYELDTAVALHAASIGWRDKCILIPGPTGAGKTSLAAWFVTRDFEFLSDELVVLAEAGRSALTIARPLLAKSEGDALVALLAASGRERTIRTADNTAVCIDPPASGSQSRRPALMIFPRFVPDSELRIEAAQPAMTGLRLMGCNLNARNLKDHGLAVLAELGRSVPALDLTYGDYGQLDGVLDVLAKFVLDSEPGVAAVRKFTAAFASSERELIDRTRRSPAPATAKPTVPEATPRGSTAPKITIGMATYDDYDGVYFTLQGIRLYHPEILEQAEFVVVDNHPDGPCAQALKGLEPWIPNYRYVPKDDISGTAVRDAVFKEASGEIVLCLDCHVLIAQGTLKRLVDYFDAHPGSRDLMQGPLLFDNLSSIATHFTPKWRAGMYGHWNTVKAAADVDHPPFEITMQGLGLFACRREAWPGFNPAFRGFGGEEGYIHEKFRQRGGRVICLPFLQWAHRFGRPGGPPYVNRWEDRIRNYFIGFRELGWATAPITEHFKEVLGVEPATRIVDAIERELAVRSARGDNVLPGVVKAEAQSLADPFASVWDEAALSQQRSLLQRVASIGADQGVALFLYWGTLLGHVRQGGILPWDDDVDLALFEPDKADALRIALKAGGMETHDLKSGGHTWIKVYDPSYPVTPHHSLPWTWPCIDIFLYAVDAPATGACPATPYPRDIILPGKMTTFEGAAVWEPQDPLAVLDRQYPEWRQRECSSAYSHRREQPAAWAERPIVTDERGCKLSHRPHGEMQYPKPPANPLSRTTYLPLLRAWDDLCRQHGMRYSIFWGTLLGQVRNQRIIPYDRDVDVVVGRSELHTIYGLPDRAPGCVFNDALKDQPAWKVNEIRLVVRRELSSIDGPRFDHRGRLVPTQIDSCAFNAPLARLIIRLPPSSTGREFWHLDVDLFTELSRFNAYPAVDDVDELPELERRMLEGMQVSCVKDAVPYLKHWYGADFMIPDHIYHGGDWVCLA